MGRHSDPERRDTNPLHGLFRDYEPAHGQPLGDPDERDPDQVETFDPITSTAASAETTVFEYGRSPAYPAFQPDPEPYPGEPTEFEPPPDVNLADYEPARRPRVWLVALGLSGALCAVVLAGWVGRTTAPSEPASVALSPSPSPSVVTVTATPKRGGKPRPAVTVWRTRTPEPRTVVEVSRVPVPGPKVTTTRTVTPKPKVSVKISPVPGPTCTITIFVEPFGDDREERSGSCPD